MKINFITDDEYLNHDTGPSHPENIERYKVVKSLLDNSYSNHNFIKPRAATIEELSLVHDKEYIKKYINKFRYRIPSGSVHLWYANGGATRGGPAAKIRYL